SGRCCPLYGPRSTNHASPACPRGPTDHHGARKTAKHEVYRSCQLMVGQMPPGGGSIVNIALIKIFPSEDRYPRWLRGEQGGVLGPIDGAAADATELTAYLAAYLDTL